MNTTPLQTFLCALVLMGSGGAWAKSTNLKPSSPLPDRLQGLMVKDFPADWEDTLYAKGERRWRSGEDELKWIGMPVGGIYAGQVYLGGDGTLWHWDVFNEHMQTWGTFYMDRMDPDAPRTRFMSDEALDSVNQGFAIKWKTADGEGINSLDKNGFEDIQFLGEYPMGFVNYCDASAPISVGLTAFSPFVPLSADDSSFPATVMQYSVTNTSKKAVDIEMGGWLGNHALMDTGAPEGLMGRQNTIVSDAGRTTLLCRVEPKIQDASERSDLLIDNFGSGTYDQWTVTGNAFGDAPVPRWKATVQGVYADVNCPYLNLVHTYFSSLRGKSDAAKKNVSGRMLRDAFKIERDYVWFWIGGGNTPEKTCVNLLVEGEVVDSMTGEHDAMMRPVYFDVKQYAGKEAQLEVVVDLAGDEFNWISTTGFIQTDDRVAAIKKLSRDYGSMALSFLGRDEVTSFADLSGTTLPEAWKSGAVKANSTASAPLEGSLAGGLSTSATLRPGESKTFTWLVSWYFPNHYDWGNNMGRHYATRFSDAGDVAKSIHTGFTRLEDETRLWHSTWYDSTLPQWFLDRTFQNTSVLATSTARRYRNGQFWAWEGVGNCAGTCTHVWQYAQAMARIFPELERNCRTKTDYGFGMVEDGGIRIRGSFGPPAVDGQAGVILRTYREHQMSADDQFLTSVWPKVKKAMDFLIAMDNGQGLLEGEQHNTLDSNWYGQVSWLSGLYIASLRATEEMAIEMGDLDYAKLCRNRWQTGSKSMVSTLYNGTYFINVLDPDNLDSINSGTGCLTDQVMGQGWAFQVGLGRILPKTETRSALRTLFDYNFTTDVGPFREKYTKARDFAVAGEPGLIGCTFPDPEWRLEESAGPNGNPDFVGYFNECQSGYEYEAAAHMIAEGMVSEGLTIIKAVDIRYEPSRRNPFNEVEAGAHYARSMAVYGAYITACGYEYHGPKGYLAFAPKLNENDFKAAFTAAEGWGTLEQKRSGKSQRNSITVKHGQLSLKTIAVEIPRGMTVHEAIVKLDEQDVDLSFKQNGSRVVFELNERIAVPAGKTITIGMR